MANGTAGAQTYTRQQVIDQVVRDMFGYFGDLDANPGAEAMIEEIRRRQPGFTPYDLTGPYGLVRHLDGAQIEAILRQLPQRYAPQQIPLILREIEQERRAADQDQARDAARQREIDTAAAQLARESLPVHRLRQKPITAYVPPELEDTLERIRKAEGVEREWWRHSDTYNRVIRAVDAADRQTIDNWTRTVRVTRQESQRLRQVEQQNAALQTRIVNLRAQIQAADRRDVPRLRTQLQEAESEQKRVQKVQSQLEKRYTQRKVSSSRDISDAEERYSRRINSIQADRDRKIERRMRAERKTKEEIAEAKAEDRVRARFGVMPRSRAEYEQRTRQRAAELGQHVREIREGTRTPGYRLHFVNTKGDTPVESDTARVAYPILQEESRDPRGRITAGGFYRRQTLRLAREKSSTVQALENQDSRQTLVDSIQQQLEETVDQTLLVETGGEATSPTTGRPLRQDIAERVAVKIAPEIASRYQAAVGQHGRRVAAQLALDSLLADEDVRKKVAGAIIETYVDNGQDVSNAAAIANSLIDPVIETLGSGVTIAPAQVEYNLIQQGKLSRSTRRQLKNQYIEGDVLIRKETRYVEDNEGHTIPIETETAVLPRATDIAVEYGPRYRARKWFSDKSRLLGDYISGGTLQERAQREAYNKAFIAGVMDFEQEMRANPNGVIQRLPLYSSVYLNALTLVGQPIENAFRRMSYEAQGATVGATSALIGLGPLALPLAINHIAQQRYKKFQKEYMPYLKTDEWAKWYAEGQMQRFAAWFIPGLSYDAKHGRIVPMGLGAINTGYRALVGNLGKFIVHTQINKRRKALTDPTVKIGWGTRALEAWGTNIRDRRRNSNPMNLFIIMPIQALLGAAVQTVVLSIARATGITRGLTSGLSGLGEGNFREAWRSGGGWANTQHMNALRNAKIGQLEGLTLAEREIQVTRLTNLYSRLNRVGQTVRFVSGVWKGGKLALGGALRFGVLYFGAQLLGLSQLQALGLAGSYSTWWTMNKFMNSEFFGGRYVWDRTAGIIEGKYIPGVFGRESALGRLLETYHTPFGARMRLPTGGWMKASTTAWKLFPMNGFFLSTILLSLGVPWYFAAVPFAADLGIKVFAELANSRFAQRLGLWLKGGTAILDTVISVGQISYAMEKGGGFSGLWDFFRPGGQNIPNLMKFLTFPLTFVAFFSLASLGLATIPALIVAAIATAAVIIIDEIIRYFNDGKGLWHYIFEPAVEWAWRTFGEPIYEQTIGRITNILSALAGVFGILRSAMRGDLVGVMTSIVMMVYSGTIVLAAPATADFYTASSKESNRWIRDAHKRYDGAIINSNGFLELTYSYDFVISTSHKDDFKDRPGQGMILNEDDFFIGIQPEDVSRVTDTRTSSIMESYPDTDFRGNHLDHNYTSFALQNEEETEIIGTWIKIDPEHTYYVRDADRGENLHMYRRFTVVLNKTPDQLFGDEGGLICNKLIINIADPVYKKSYLLFSVNKTEAPVVREKCIRITPPYNELQAPLESFSPPITPSQAVGSLYCYGRSNVLGASTDNCPQEEPVYHYGVGLAVNNSTSENVYTVADGEVLSVEQDNGTNTSSCKVATQNNSPKYIITIWHEEYNRATVYGNITRANVSVGAYVKNGDKIGTITTEPNIGGTLSNQGEQYSYLHFGLINGDPRNNESIFIDPCSDEAPSFASQMCKAWFNFGYKCDMYTQ